jgi:hypothetical protein
MRNIFQRDLSRPKTTPQTWLSRSKSDRLLVPHQSEPMRTARPSGLFGVLVSPFR